jgi:P-loop Domain of unknown function (DUF2791)
MSQGAVYPREDVVSALEHLVEYGVPSPGAARMFDVGTESFIAYFEKEVLDELVARGGSTCKIFEGSYGSGKTHLLQLMEDSALDRGLAVVRTSLSDAMNLEDWHLITRHILQNIEIQTSTGVVRSLPAVIDAVSREHGHRKLDLLRTSLPHSGFAKAISLRYTPTGLTSGGRELIGDYLLGEKVSVLALKGDDILGVKHPLSRRNAETVLKTILASLHRLGVPGTLLLFDETEHTFSFKRSVPSKRVKDGANLLRRLIDASANGSLVGTAIAFAVLPDFIDNCRLAYEALGQRLSRAPRVGQVSWRWPVLPLDSITTEPEPHQFVAALVDRHQQVLSGCGVELNGVRNAMLQAGRATLKNHAGSDYRRYVVKKVASLSLSRIS